MRSTVIAVHDIPGLEHDEAIALAAVEYERLLDAVAQLGPEDWSCPTDCIGGDVKAMLAHVLGMMEADSGPGEIGSQLAAATSTMQETGGYRIDALTAIEIEKHVHRSAEQLIDALGQPLGATGS